jgi:hypothetical protein
MTIALQHERLLVMLEKMARLTRSLPGTGVVRTLPYQCGMESYSHWHSINRRYRTGEMCFRWTQQRDWCLFKQVECDRWAIHQ